MSIIVFQHGASVGPGRLGLTLRDHGFKLDIRRLDLPQTRTNPHVPADFESVEGIVVMGGEMNVTDIARFPWMAAEVEYIKEAHRRQLPLIGVCLGHQLIAHALGGTVAPAATPEHGFVPVRIEVPGQTEIMLAGIPWQVPQLQSHNQEVTALPPGATVLASSATCKVQAFRAGLRTIGFQYHFECDRESAAAIVGNSVPDLAAQLDAHYPMFARVADRLSVNLATYLFPARVRLAV